MRIAPPSLKMLLVLILFICRNISIGDTLSSRYISINMPGHTSLVLPDELIQQIFEDTIPASKCLPNYLFKCKSTKGGITSDWRVVVQYIPTLSLVLAQTGGKQLAQRPLVKQFDKYLKSLDPPKQWATTDLDETCDYLRRSSP